jgi:uncharacterized secreted repeat protein (TIGR03808 family)
MKLDRRGLFAALGGAATFGAATPALAHRSSDQGRREHERVDPQPAGSVAPRPSVDGASLGLRANAADDQSTALQRAINYAAAARAVLQLAPGFYRAAGLQLPPYAAITGVSGATRILQSSASPPMSASGSNNISISGLILDGSNIPLRDRQGLINLTHGRFVRVTDCQIVNSGGDGIVLEAVAGEVSGNTVSAADAAIFSIDALGLNISGNHVTGAGNNGILVWRSAPGDDGTLVADNRIENITNKSGGSGQYGNAINVFRANNVIVRGNRISNAAFSAVRGNAASNLQIAANTCTGLGEVALYAEFGFEGAVIANNIVDGAAMGVSVTNFNDGGRLAVVQGNLIRNLIDHRPPGTDPNDGAGIGIGVEADSVVNGNVIENAPHTGISVGAGQYLRDVAVSANIVRNSNYGITVSVAPGAGTSLISDNLIGGARLGAIVGMEWKKPVTGDLAKEGAERYTQLTINNNRVR